jgi:hypothetical protein
MTAALAEELSMQLAILILNLLTVTTARAEIPRELYPQGNCRPLTVAPEASDGGVRVLSGVHCDSLYADASLIEFEVDDLAATKEFHIYDRNEMYEFERARKGHFVSWPKDIGYQDGAMLYLGKTSAGRDRFLLNLTSVTRPSPAAPVEIYVKQAGRELKGRAVFLD